MASVFQTFETVAALGAVFETLSVLLFPAGGKMAFFGCVSWTSRLGGSGSRLRSFGGALPSPDSGARSASDGIGGRFLCLAGTAFLGETDDGSESDE